VVGTLLCTRICATLGCNCHTVANQSRNYDYIRMQRRNITHDMQELSTMTEKFRRMAQNGEDS